MSNKAFNNEDNGTDENKKIRKNCKCKTRKKWKQHERAKDSKTKTGRKRIKTK